MAHDTVNVGGMWFTVKVGKGTISMISRMHGRYTGTVVNTMSGKQVLFSHNGHRYQGSDVEATFAKMMKREVR